MTGTRAANSPSTSTLRSPPEKATSTRGSSNSDRVNWAVATAFAKRKPKAPGPTSIRKNSTANPPPGGTPPTRGIPKDAQLADIKGKWVLVYFWGPWCHPCLGREIPALMKFYDAHAADRDRFEIVSICTSEPQIKTMADLDRELKPVVKAVWHGRPIPFPIVLDNTLESTEHFGLAASKLLFNPEGRLVPGDEKTLAEKLKH